MIIFPILNVVTVKNEMRNKDAMIQDIINQNLSFKDSFFVGDTVNDGLSANNNRLKFIKASYGYGKKENWSKVNIHKEILFFSEITKLY